MEVSERKEIIMLAGIASVASVLVMFLKTRKFIKSASSVEGEVVRHGVDSGMTSPSLRQAVAIIKYRVGDNTYTCKVIINSKINENRGQITVFSNIRKNCYLTPIFSARSCLLLPALIQPPGRGRCNDYGRKICVLPHRSCEAGTGLLIR